jgi:broad specificity phosphatase PhoE
VSEPALPPLGVRQRGPAPTETRLLLIRHAESTANAEGVAGGEEGDRGLTPLGRRQAQALAQRLVVTNELREATALYCSHLPRAQETAAIVAASVRHLSPVVTHDIDELRVGQGDGLTWAEFERRFGGVDWDVDPSVPNAPGGESLLAFYERTTSTMQALAARHPGELVAVVCHGGVIEQMTKFALGLDPGRRIGQRIEHCSLTEIEHGPARTRLLRYNELAGRLAD